MLLNLSKMIVIAVIFCYSFSKLSFGQDQDKVSPWDKLDVHALEKECLSSATDDDACNQIAQRIESMVGEKPAEAPRMLMGILRGNAMGIGNGWFKPPQQRYSWEWLATRCGVDGSQALKQSDFIGEAALFERLDRNGDGQIEEDDFDWSSDSLFVREMGVANQIFRAIDRSGDSEVTQEELLAFFERTKKDNSNLSVYSFRRAVPLGRNRSPYLSGDEPTRARLLEGFFKSELGSFFEGPSLGEMAPDFELKTQDGVKTVRLSKHFGDKPIVLVFGNYTCGPFRRFYKEIDEICFRMKDRVHCFGIYVREAHPEDGWIMESNTSVGVRLPQPKTMEERVSVAQTCAVKLAYRMPLLVDSIDDDTGNKYSAMPGRVYILDRTGHVVYKAARGPFGFRPGEVEQALVMSIMDNKSSPGSKDE